MRQYHKKATPIEEKNSFVVKLEDVTEDDDSQNKSKVDHKLPDKISSRDD